MVGSSAAPVLAALLSARLCGAASEQDGIEPFRPKVAGPGGGLRSNWCDIDYVRGTITGRKVSVVLEDDPHHFLIARNGSGYVTGGYFVEVFAKVAHRAGFMWEAYAMNDTDKDEWDSFPSFDDKVFSMVAKYDIFLGGVTQRPARRMKGMLFGYPLLSDDPVLVTYTYYEDPSELSILFSFMRPFGISSWGALLVMFLVTAAAYAVVEWDGDDVKGHTRLEALSQTLFLTVGSFTGGAGFGPTTRPGRFLTITWTFVVLLLTSAYTANLASLLVVKGDRRGEVKGFQDAVKRSLPLCTLPGSAHEEMLKSRYPTALVKSYGDFRSGGNTLEDVHCLGAVLGRFRWDAMQGQPSLNPGCRMGEVGRSLMTVHNSFAGLERDCEGRLINVINAHIQDLYEEGWLDRALQRNMRRISSQNCEEIEERESEAGSALDFTQLGGIFNIALVGAIIAVVWHGFNRWRKQGGSAKEEEFVPLPSGGV